MKTVLQIAGAALLLMGIAVLATGNPLWIPASPEVDSGPPARIAGAVTGAIGLVLLLLATILFQRKMRE